VRSISRILSGWLLNSDLQYILFSLLQDTLSSEGSSEILELLLIINLRSIDERSLVYFADNERHTIDAYVECGEGIDRAGGFAIQVRRLRFVAAITDS